MRGNGTDIRVRVVLGMTAPPEYPRMNSAGKGGTDGKGGGTRQDMELVSPRVKPLRVDPFLFREASGVLRNSFKYLPMATPPEDDFPPRVC